MNYLWPRGPGTAGYAAALEMAKCSSGSDSGLVFSVSSVVLGCDG
jgi:hypothetical protein